jgi:hypothetical protein
MRHFQSHILVYSLPQTLSRSALPPTIIALGVTFSRRAALKGAVSVQVFLSSFFQLDV